MFSIIVLCRFTISIRRFGHGRVRFGSDRTPLVRRRRRRRRAGGATFSLQSWRVLSSAELSLSDHHNRVLLSSDSSDHFYLLHFTLFLLSRKNQKTIVFLPAAVNSVVLKFRSRRPRHCSARRTRRRSRDVESDARTGHG